MPMVKQDLEAKGVIKIRFVAQHPRTQMLCLNKRALKDLGFNAIFEEHP